MRQSRPTSRFTQPPDRGIPHQNFNRHNSVPVRNFRVDQPNRNPRGTSRNVEFREPHSLQRCQTGEDTDNALDWQSSYRLEEDHAPRGPYRREEDSLRDVAIRRANSYLEAPVIAMRQSIPNPKLVPKRLCAVSNQVPAEMIRPQAPVQHVRPHAPVRVPVKPSVEVPPQVSSLHQETENPDYVGYSIELEYEMRREERKRQQHKIWSPTARNSNNQRVQKLQYNWWLGATPESGYEEGITFDHTTDPYLIRHVPIVVESLAHLQIIRGELVFLLNAVRSSNVIFKDRAYFAREFLMMKTHVSYRYETSKDVPEMKNPPTLECGYFPENCLTVRDRIEYVADRYHESVKEFQHLTPGLKRLDTYLRGKNLSITYISPRVLYEYHTKGRHIHGFFWPVVTLDGTNRTYLIDINNFFMFPLYSNYRNWSESLKHFFDVITTFNIHLTEVYNSNKLLFDSMKNVLFSAYFVDNKLKDPNSREERVMMIREQNRIMFNDTTVAVGGLKEAETVHEIKFYTLYHALKDQSYMICEGKMAQNLYFKYRIRKPTTSVRRREARAAEEFRNVIVAEEPLRPSDVNSAEQFHQEHDYSIHPDQFIDNGQLSEEIYVGYHDDQQFDTLYENQDDLSILQFNEEFENQLNEIETVKQPFGSFVSLCNDYSSNSHDLDQLRPLIRSVSENSLLVDLDPYRERMEDILCQFHELQRTTVKKKKKRGGRKLKQFRGRNAREKNLQKLAEYQNRKNLENESETDQLPNLDRHISATIAILDFTQQDSGVVPSFETPTEVHEIGEVLRDLVVQVSSNVARSAYDKKSMVIRKSARFQENYVNDNSEFSPDSLKVRAMEILTGQQIKNDSELWQARVIVMEAIHENDDDFVIPIFDKSKGLELEQTGLGKTMEMDCQHLSEDQMMEEPADHTQLEDVEHELVDNSLFEVVARREYFRKEFEAFQSLDVFTVIAETDKIMLEELGDVAGVKFDDVVKYFSELKVQKPTTNPLLETYFESITKCFKYSTTDGQEVVWSFEPDIDLMMSSLDKYVFAKDDFSMKRKCASSPEKTEPTAKVRRTTSADQGINLSKAIESTEALVEKVDKVDTPLAESEQLQSDDEEETTEALSRKRADVEFSDDDSIVAAPPAKRAANAVSRLSNHSSDAFLSPSRQIEVDMDQDILEETPISVSKDVMFSSTANLEIVGKYDISAFESVSYSFNDMGEFAKSQKEESETAKYDGNCAEFECTQLTVRHDEAQDLTSINAEPKGCSEFQYIVEEMAVATLNINEENVILAGKEDVAEKANTFSISESVSTSATITDYDHPFAQPEDNGIVEKTMLLQECESVTGSIVDQQQDLTRPDELAKTDFKYEMQSTEFVSAEIRHGDVSLSNPEPTISIETDLQVQDMESAVNTIIENGSTLSKETEEEQKSSTWLIHDNAKVVVESVQLETTSLASEEVQENVSTQFDLETRDSTTHTIQSMEESLSQPDTADGVATEYLMEARESISTNVVCMEPVLSTESAEEAASGVFEASQVLETNLSVVNNQMEVNNIEKNEEERESCLQLQETSDAALSVMVTEEMNIEQPEESTKVAVDVATEVHAAEELTLTVLELAQSAEEPEELIETEFTQQPFEETAHDYIESAIEADQQKEGMGLNSNIGISEMEVATLAVQSCEEKISNDEAPLTMETEKKLPICPREIVSASIVDEPVQCASSESPIEPTMLNTVFDEDEPFVQNSISDRGLEIQENREVLSPSTHEDSINSLDEEHVAQAENCESLETEENQETSPVETHGELAEPNFIESLHYSNEAVEENASMGEGNVTLAENFEDMELQVDQGISSYADCESSVEQHFIESSSNSNDPSVQNVGLDEEDGVQAENCEDLEGQGNDGSLSSASCENLVEPNFTEMPSNSNDSHLQNIGLDEEDVMQAENCEDLEVQQNQETLPTATHESLIDSSFAELLSIIDESSAQFAKLEVENIVREENHEDMETRENDESLSSANCEIPSTSKESFVQSVGLNNEDVAQSVNYEDLEIRENKEASPSETRDDQIEPNFFEPLHYTDESTVQTADKEIEVRADEETIPSASNQEPIEPNFIERQQLNTDKPVCEDTGLAEQDTLQEEDEEEGEDLSIEETEELMKVIRECSLPSSVVTPLYDDETTVQNDNLEEGGTMMLSKNKDKQESASRSSEDTVESNYIETLFNTNQESSSQCASSENRTTASVANSEGAEIQRNETSMPGTSNESLMKPNSIDFPSVDIGSKVQEVEGTVRNAPNVEFVQPSSTEGPSRDVLPVLVLAEKELDNIAPLEMGQSFEEQMMIKNWNFNVHQHIKCKAFATEMNGFFVPLNESDWNALKTSISALTINSDLRFWQKLLHQEIPSINDYGQKSFSECVHLIWSKLLKTGGLQEIMQKQPNLCMECVEKEPIFIQKCRCKTNGRREIIVEVADRKQSLLGMFFCLHGASLRLELIPNVSPQAPERQQFGDIGHHHVNQTHHYLPNHDCVLPSNPPGYQQPHWNSQYTIPHQVIGAHSNTPHVPQSSESVRNNLLPMPQMAQACAPPMMGMAMGSAARTGHESMEPQASHLLPGPSTGVHFCPPAAKETKKPRKPRQKKTQQTEGQKKGKESKKTAAQERNNASLALSQALQQSSRTPVMPNQFLLPQQQAGQFPQFVPQPLLAQSASQHFYQNPAMNPHQLPHMVPPNYYHMQQFHGGFPQQNPVLFNQEAMAYDRIARHQQAELHRQQQQQQQRNVNRPRVANPNQLLQGSMFHQSPQNQLASPYQLPPHEMQQMYPMQQDLPPPFAFSGPTTPQMQQEMNQQQVQYQQNTHQQEALGGRHALHLPPSQQPGLPQNHGQPRRHEPEQFPQLQHAPQVPNPYLNNPADRSNNRTMTHQMMPGTPMRPNNSFVPAQYPQPYPNGAYRNQDMQMPQTSPHMGLMNRANNFPVNTPPISEGYQQNQQVIGCAAPNCMLPNCLCRQNHEANLERERLEMQRNRRRQDNEHNNMNAGNIAHVPNHGPWNQQYMPPQMNAYPPNMQYPQNYMQGNSNGNNGNNAAPNEQNHPNAMHPNNNFNTRATAETLVPENTAPQTREEETATDAPLPLEVEAPNPLSSADGYVPSSPVQNEGSFAEDNEHSSPPIQFNDSPAVLSPLALQDGLTPPSTFSSPGESATGPSPRRDLDRSLMTMKVTNRDSNMMDNVGVDDGSGLLTRVQYHAVPEYELLNDDDIAFVAEEVCEDITDDSKRTCQLRGYKAFASKLNEVLEQNRGRLAKRDSSDDIYYEEVRIRSKSEEPIERVPYISHEKEGQLQRSSSSYRLNELETYTKKKVEMTKSKFGPFVNSRTDEMIIMDKDEYNKELLDMDKLFGGSDIDDATKFGFMKTFLTFQKYNTINDDVYGELEAKQYSEISTVFGHVSLQAYRGDKNSARIPKFKDGVMCSGQSISVSMDALLKFQSFKQALLSSAAKTIDKLPALKHKRNCSLHKMVDAYMIIFKFRLALLEDIINRVGSRIFNPLLTTEAERNRDESIITKVMSKMMTQLTIAKFHMFDLSPIQSIMQEMTGMPKILSNARVANNGASLAIIALERSRVIALLSELRGERLPEDEIEGFVASVDVLSLTQNDAVPEDMDTHYLYDAAVENKFCPHMIAAQLKKLNVKQNMSLATIVNGFFEQLKPFYMFLENVLECSLDRRIIMYLENKALVNLVRMIHAKGGFFTKADFKQSNPSTNGLIVSAVAAAARRQHNVETEANNILSMLERETRVDIDSPMIQPPTLGIVFNYLETSIHVSMIVERQIELDRDQRVGTRRYKKLTVCCQDFNKIVVLKGFRCNLTIKKAEETLQIQLLGTSNAPLCDEFTIGGLRGDLIKNHPIDWHYIEQEIVWPRLNNIVNNPEIGTVDYSVPIKFPFKRSVRPTRITKHAPLADLIKQRKVISRWDMEFASQSSSTHYNFKSKDATELHNILLSTREIVTNADLSKRLSRLNVDNSMEMSGNPGLSSRERETSLPFWHPRAVQSQFGNHLNAATGMYNYQEQGPSHMVPAEEEVMDNEEDDDVSTIAAAPYDNCFQETPDVADDGEGEDAEINDSQDDGEGANVAGFNVSARKKLNVDNFNFDYTYDDEDDNEI